MLTQKVIFKLLNITKSSRFLLLIIFGIIGFSAGFYQHLDMPKGCTVLFTDTSVQAGPPWPD
ncbi:hypothetical protein HYV10_02450 [Candidatus Dependentiae bacterium]|nr:hypothetical protein [Candidatus Dependentiae bacterium]